MTRKERGDMQFNRLYFVPAVIMLLAIIGMVGLSGSAHAANPIISVSPASVTVTQGQTFTVDVVIDYMANMYAFQFSLSFDKTKLAATSITYGGYLNEPTLELANIIDNSLGYVTYARTSVLPAPAKTGGSPPPLATIHFTAIAAGSSPLHLYSTILNDNGGLEIPHTTEDGQVTIKSTQVGGEWAPIDTLSTLAPWITLVAAVAASGAAAGLFKRRLNREIK